MQNANIENWTHRIGKDQGYLELVIRVEPIEIAPDVVVARMVSAWTPSPKELEALNKGASVHVSLITNGHPPINVEVGNPPE